MIRKDASKIDSRARSWRVPLSFVIGAVALVAACVVLRWAWGPESAIAQAPQRAAPRNPASGPVEQSAAPAASRVPADAAPAQAPHKLPVMAIVNGEPISRQELAQECLSRYGKDVLESIVNKHLIWQECQKRGIGITEKDVDEEVTRMAAKFGLSPSRWLEMLREEREISPEQYRREIIWPSLALRALAEPRLVVSDEELARAFESEFGPRIKARIIAVGAAQKAERIRAEAAANPDQFGELAKQYSEDQSASVQGLIPPIRRYMGDDEFERVAFGLREGEVSRVVAVAGQHVILKCEQRMPPTYVADKFRLDAENRLRDRIRDQKLRTAAAELFKQLQDAARVVNVMNDPEVARQMPGVAALINGQQIPIHQLAEECLIRHGQDVLDGEVNRKILLQALKRRGKAVTEADLDREIARAAESYGFVKPDGTPDIESWLKQVVESDNATVELYVRDAVWPTVALKKLVTEAIEVTEEDLQRGFESNYGERVQVLMIVFNNQRQAHEVWEMARNNPTEQFFAELAHQYSVDPVSRENFGKVPPIRRYSGHAQLEDEAFSLQAGGLSGIIAAADRFVVIKCLGRTDPVVTAMDDEVRRELYLDIYEKKTRAAIAREFDRLVAAAQIDNYLRGSSQFGKGAPRPESSLAIPVSQRPAAGSRSP